MRSLIAHWCCCCFLGLIAIVGQQRADAAGVMGIDFGTDWTKVALVKPGVPLEIVLNKDSKRKTEAVVTIRDGIRTFGADGLNLGLRYPQESYGKLKTLLGRRFDDPAAADYRDCYDNTMIESGDRKTVAFQHDDSTVYTVEELVAMQLASARKDVERFAEEAVRDAVITVPPFWTQTERQALLDAAEIAGIRVLALMNDETAVALNYAMTRSFDDKPQLHVFFDMGAGSTVATLVEFKTVKDGDGKWAKNITSIEVKSVGYDRSLGGHEFDIRLQRLLAKKFQDESGKKFKVPVVQSHRAMAKLLKEANRIKHILTANNDVMASVEGLHEEIDFKAKVSRKDMEELVGDVVDRVYQPIESALRAAGKSKDDITSFIMVGGSMRVPAVLAKLESVVGAEKIAKHVNADEAAVLGAAYRAAALSVQFRVRQFRVKDIITSPIVLSYESAKGGGKIIKQKLFKELSPIDVHKKVSFKQSADFKFDLSYGEEVLATDPKFGPTGISVTEISGVDAVVADAKKANASEPKIKVLIGVSANGLVFVEKATAEYTIAKQESASIGEALRDTVMSFFGGGSDKSDPPAESTEESSNSTVVDDSLQNNVTNQAVLNETEAAGAAAAKNETKEQKVSTALTIKTTLSTIRPMSTDEKTDCIKRATEMDAQDFHRISREEARNNLESFVYTTLDALDRDSVILVSTDSEREQLRKKLSEMSEWLYDDGELPTTATDEFRTRLTVLKSLYEPIQSRVTEVKERPEAIKRLNTSIAEARTFLATAQKNDTKTGFFYPEDTVQKLKGVIEQVEMWIETKQSMQKQLKPTDTPAFTSKDVKEKIASIVGELYMAKSKKKTVPRSTTTTATTPTTSVANSTTTEPIAAHTTQTPVETPASTDGAPTDHDEL